MKESEAQKKFCPLKTGCECLGKPCMWWVQTEGDNTGDCIIATVGLTLLTQTFNGKFTSRE